MSHKIICSSVYIFTNCFTRARCGKKFTFSLVYIFTNPFPWQDMTKGHLLIGIHIYHPFPTSNMWHKVIYSLVYIFTNPFTRPRCGIKSDKRFIYLPTPLHDQDVEQGHLFVDLYTYQSLHTNMMWYNFIFSLVYIFTNHVSQAKYYSRWSSLWYIYIYQRFHTSNMGHRAICWFVYIITHLFTRAKCGTKSSTRYIYLSTPHKSKMWHKVIYLLYLLTNPSILAGCVTRSSFLWYK